MKAVERNSAGKLTKYYKYPMINIDLWFDSQEKFD